MKIQFLKKENHFKKKDFELNPNMYWKCALIVAFVFIILSAFLGFRLFRQVTRDTTSSDSNTDGQTLLVSQDRIQKSLQYFDEREEKSLKIINSPANVVDPSL